MTKAIFDIVIKIATHLRPTPFGARAAAASVLSAALLLSTALVISAAACTAESSSGQLLPINGNNGRGGGVAGGSGGALSPGSVSGSNCPMANATQSCFCNKNGQQVPGRQVCGAVSGWGPCECAEIPETIVTSTTAHGNLADPAANKDPTIDFKWHRSMPEGGSCEAGFYQGAFDGLYNPEATVALTLGFWTSIPVFGNVEFTINEKPGTNGEFLEIADGHFIGAALMAFPFEGDFYGTLDCPSKAFDGLLKNCYYIVGFDKYAFDGIALSKYDIVNHTFVQGVWSVTEPPNALIESPTMPDAGTRVVDDSEFPDPLPVQAGSPLPAFYPVGFKGGTGTWWANFIHP